MAPASCSISSNRMLAVKPAGKRLGGWRYFGFSESACSFWIATVDKRPHNRQLPGEEPEVRVIQTATLWFFPRQLTSKKHEWDLGGKHSMELGRRFHRQYCAKSLSAGDSELPAKPQAWKLLKLN